MNFPEGFRIAGVKDDKVGMGFIYAPEGMSSAGVFTNNASPAEPVKYCREKIKDSDIRAVFVNKGSANAATGPEGKKRMLQLLGAASSGLGISKDEILPASTGVIGRHIEYSESLLNRLLSRKEEVDPVSFSEAIMTTDTVNKIAWSTFELAGREVTICGIAKGAGMICPDMATMLAFIMTDADISGGLLDKALRESVDLSFNSLSVDGETSTNDTVFLLSSGKSDTPKIEKEGNNFSIFQKHLDRVAVILAEKIASDGEGATKFIKVSVTGAADDAEARRAARVIGASPLCKTAFYGASPNWGRIISAIGGAKIGVNLEKFNVRVNGVPLVTDGVDAANSAKQAHEVMTGGRYKLEIDLGRGQGSGLCYTCDYSPEYVRINANYLS